MVGTGVGVASAGVPAPLSVYFFFFGLKRYFSGDKVVQQSVRFAVKFDGCTVTDPWVVNFTAIGGYLGASRVYPGLGDTGWGGVRITAAGGGIVLFVTYSLGLCLLFSYSSRRLYLWL